MESDEELSALRPLVLSDDSHGDDRQQARILITSAGKERDLQECTWVVRLMYSSKRIEVIKVKGEVYVQVN
jgi:hypothetical protein